MLCGIGDANDKRSLCLLWRGLTSVITDASGFARDGQTAVAQLAAYELRQDGPGDTAAGRPPVDNQTICRPLIRFLAEAAYSNGGIFCQSRSLSTGLPYPRDQKLRTFGSRG